MKYTTRKDWRKRKTGAKSVSHRCENHGSCSYCLSNRTISTKKREKLIIDIMKGDEELGLYTKLD